MSAMHLGLLDSSRWLLGRFVWQVVGVPAYAIDGGRIRTARRSGNKRLCMNINVFISWFGCLHVDEQCSLTGKTCWITTKFIHCLEALCHIATLNALRNVTVRIRNLKFPYMMVDNLCQIQTLRHLQRGLDLIPE